MLESARHGAEYLLLDAAHGEHTPAQGYLAGHADITAHRDAQQGGGEGRGKGDAGGRAVLGHCAFGHMDVQIDILMEIGAQAEAAGQGAEPGERGLGRFLHHFAELAGDLYLAGAGHNYGLDVPPLIFMLPFESRPSPSAST